jgi:hypothetical protein
MFHSYTLVQKWHMNRFLQKWLGYCLMQGHRFIPGQVLEPDQATSGDPQQDVASVET